MATGATIWEMMYAVPAPMPIAIAAFWIACQIWV